MIKTLSITANISSGNYCAINLEINCFETSEEKFGRYLEFYIYRLYRLHNNSCSRTFDKQSLLPNTSIIMQNFGNHKREGFLIYDKKGQQFIPAVEVRTAYRKLRNI